MGFAQGLLAGAGTARAIQDRYYESRDASNIKGVAEADAKAGEGIPAEGEETSEGLSEEDFLSVLGTYGNGDTAWNMDSLNDDGGTFATVDDVEKLKNMAMSGSFGETGVPDDPRLSGMPVQAAEGGAVGMPDDIVEMQQHQRPAPQRPTMPEEERNLLPPIKPDETIAAEAEVSPGVDMVVRSQAVAQERAGKPMLAKQVIEAQNKYLTNKRYTSLGDYNKDRRALMQRRQQYAVGYLNASKQAYSMGDAEEAQRNFRLAFGFLPTGSNVAFSDIQGKVAGATIDERSGKIRSKPFVLGSEAYESALAIMKDPAQWNLWTMKGEREQQKHDLDMQKGRAYIADAAANISTKLVPVAGRVGKGLSWSSPAQLQTHMDTVNSYVAGLAESPVFTTKRSPTDPSVNMFEDPGVQARTRFIGGGLAEANPGKSPETIALASGLLAWRDEQLSAGSPDESVQATLVPDGTSPYGHKIVIQRAATDENGDVQLDENGEVIMDTPSALDASPEIIASFGGKVTGPHSNSDVISKRMAVFKWAMEYATGKKVDMFGPPTAQQTKDLMDGKAKAVGPDKDEGVPDPDNMGIRIGELVEQVGREDVTPEDIKRGLSPQAEDTPRAMPTPDSEHIRIGELSERVGVAREDIKKGLQPQPEDKPPGRKRNAWTKPYDELTAEDVGDYSIGPAPKQAPKLPPIPAEPASRNEYAIDEGVPVARNPQAALPVPTGASPSNPPASPRMQPPVSASYGDPEPLNIADIPGGQKAIPQPDGSVTYAAREPAQLEAVPMRLHEPAPDVSNEPGMPDVVNPAASYGKPQPTPEARNMMDQLGIDPSMAAAVNGKPAPVEIPASANDLASMFGYVHTHYKTNMGKPGSPERKAITDDALKRIAYAETGNEKNPWIRTRHAPEPGSTAYGPLQITGTLWKEMAKQKYAKDFTAEERAFVDKMVAQAALFNKNGYNPAYMKANPNATDPRKMAGYDPAFDYGGAGFALTDREKELYFSTAGKTFSRYLDKYDGEFLLAVNAWRYGEQSTQSVLSPTGDTRYANALFEV